MLKLARFFSEWLFKLKFIFTLIFILSSATPTVVDAPKIIEYAQNYLTHQGTLRMTKEGFVYVKVPDEYIFHIAYLIDNEALIPPYYFGKGKIGAHISVIGADEIKNKKLILEDLGKPIDFSIVNFSYVDVKRKKELRRIYYFTVEAPALSELRIKNKLSAKLNNHDFHITCAIERLSSSNLNLKVD